MTVAVNPTQTGEPVFYLADEHPHPEGYSTSLGFWIYLMSDCLIFAMLFATFGVLGGNYAAGPAPKDLFELPLVAVNTSMLLLSSITYGFAMLTMQQNKIAQTQMWLAITGLFGLAFIGIELTEFAHMIHEGATPQRSAFLSVVLHAGRHPRPARLLRPDLAGDADGAGLEVRPDRGQPPPPDVPVDVLALPGRGLDRRLHLRLSPGSSAMNTDTHAAHADGHHHGDDHAHGTFSTYMLGFVLSVVLTAIPFWLVMSGALPSKQITALVIMAFAVVQIVVHMIYFLHMNTKSENGWSMMALIFTIVMVVIALSGSLWVMNHLNSNMMPMHQMTGMK